VEIISEKTNPRLAVGNEKISIVKFDAQIT